MNDSMNEENDEVNIEGLVAELMQRYEEERLAHMHG